MRKQSRKRAEKPKDANTPPFQSEPTEPPNIENGIAKPNNFDLNAFRSKSPATIAGVDTLVQALPCHSLAQSKDFFRLHPDETLYWTDELIIVSCPIKGDKRDTVHLITEELALRFLQSGQIQYCRFVLATKPNDVFFLARLPTRNLANPWNRDAILGAEQAKTFWTVLTRRREENIDGYKITRAIDFDAFPEPTWPKQPLNEIVKATFDGFAINHEDHPALLRLTGRKQK
jgi:hypothetical protein